MFATKLQDLGQANTQPHCIETGDALPFRQRFYRQSPKTNAEMNRQLQEMLDADIPEESDSMRQSQVVMVKKKLPFLFQDWKMYLIQLIRHKPNSFQL